jgi:hypothetical protein
MCLELYQFEKITRWCLFVLGSILEYALQSVMNLSCWKNKVVVSQNFHQTHLLEVGLTKFLRDHETLSMYCHVGLHESSMGLYAFTFVCEVNLDGLCPFDL